MSYTSLRYTEKVWNMDAINSNEFCLLMAVAKHCNDEGVCWPKPSTLMRLSHLPKSTFYRAMAKVKERGLLESWEDGNRTMYRLHLPEVMGLESQSETASPDTGIESPTVGHNNKKVEDAEELVAYGSNKVIACIVPKVAEKEEGAMLVTEVLANKGKKQGKGPKTLNAKLEMMWKEIVASEYEIDKTLPPFTAKQKGQIKLFIGKVTGDEAEQVMREALLNWSEFTSLVRTNHAIPSTPAEPSLNFLLSYATDAVKFVSAQSKPAPIATTCTAPITDPVAEKDESYEEFLKSMGSQ